jgi:hypothetical protein
MRDVCCVGHVCRVMCHAMGYVRHAVFTLSQTAEFDMHGAHGVVCIPSLNAGFSELARSSIMEATAWTHDDLLVNLTAYVQDAKREYGIPSLDCAPDCELVPLRFARIGDLVPLGKGRVGVVFDIAENRGVAEFSIVTSTLRVVMKRTAL